MEIYHLTIFDVSTDEFLFSIREKENFLFQEVCSVHQVAECVGVHLRTANLLASMVAVPMYAKGMSTRDIQEHLHKLYGIESPRHSKLLPNKMKWQNRPLQSVYSFVFIDAIQFKVKQDGQIINKAA